VVLLLPLLLAAGACGDDSGDSASDTTTTTAAAKSSEASDDEQLAADVVLRLADLPSGYTEDEATPDEQDEGDPVDQCLGDEAAELDAATTAEADSPDFSRGETTTVGSDAAVLKEERDAEQAMDLISSDTFKQCLDAAVVEELKSGTGEEGVTFGDVSLEDASFANVADETKALQFSVAIQAEGQEFPFYVDIVVFRAGRVVASLTLANLGEPYPASVGVDLARKMAARAKAA
jgi:hypothetical protein